MPMQTDRNVYDFDYLMNVVNKNVSDEEGNPYEELRSKTMFDNLDTYSTANQ